MMGGVNPPPCRAKWPPQVAVGLGRQLRCEIERGGTHRVPPIVLLFNEFQIYQGFRGGHPGYGADLGVEQLEQLGVVLADHLRDRVEGAGGQHDVVDGVDLRQLLGDLRGVPPRAADPNHRLSGEPPQLERIGHRDDLHDTGIHQTLHPLAHRRLREPDGLTDRGIGTTAVLLQLLDNGLGHLVQLDRSVPTSPMARTGNRVAGTPESRMPMIVHGFSCLRQQDR